MRQPLIVIQEFHAIDLVLLFYVFTDLIAAIEKNEEWSIQSQVITKSEKGDHIKLVVTFLTTEDLGNNDLNIEKLITKNFENDENSRTGTYQNTEFPNLQSGLS